MLLTGRTHHFSKRGGCIQ